MASISYKLLYAFTWLLSLIPYWFIYRVSDLLFFIIYYIVRYRKKVVFKNLRTSFPDKSDQEITQIAKRFYRHFSDFLVEIIKVMSISEKELNRRMRFLNPEVFDALAADNRSIALVTAHYNNWEMMPHVARKMKHKCMIIYRPLKNKLSDKISLHMRSRFGADMISMESIFRETLRSRSQNELFSVWFLADQRPPRNSRFWTRFLNHEAAFFEGVEKISRKMELAVVFMDIRKVKRGFYEVWIEKLIDNAALTHENEVTLTCVKKMEEVILGRPDYWLWSHKRFKHARPENIKLITE